MLSRDRDVANDYRLCYRASLLCLMPSYESEEIYRPSSIGDESRTRQLEWSIRLMRERLAALKSYAERVAKHHMHKEVDREREREEGPFMSLGARGPTQRAASR